MSNQTFTSNQTFGQWLKRQIEDLGMTQREFAEANDFSISVVSKWIIGIKRPSGLSASRLAKALGISRDAIDRKIGERIAA